MAGPEENGGSDVRALVVANEAVVGPELRDSLIEHLGTKGGKVFVVAPALVDSGFKHTLGDVDDAVAPAQQRLQETLEELRKAGIDASGEVGDSDPMLAISDEMLKFHPDQVLVVAHRDAEGAFAERGLLELMERDLDLPVTELIVDRADTPHVLDVQETAPVAGRKKGWRPSSNMPPLSRREFGGILVAVLGTLLLAGLAADCVGSHNPSDLGPACIARVLLALAFALLNLAHIVGLFLFQSVGYQGMFSRMFARLSLYGTPSAVVISLLLGLFM